MAQLKAYEWERSKFPTERLINIRYEYREKLTLKLCQYFNLHNVRLELTSHGGGRAWGSHRIRLPNRNYKCPLGTVYHEIAHLLNSRNGGNGHTGTFKHYLIKVYVEGRSQLKKIFNEIRNEDTQSKIQYSKELQKEIRVNERKRLLSEFRKTKDYKLKNLEERIKRLESRKKRIETLLKSANRSKNSLLRYKNKELILS